MYAGSIGWPPPTFMSMDWSPLPSTDAGENLWVTVGDALRPKMNTIAPWHAQ